MMQYVIRLVAKTRDSTRLGKTMLVYNVCKCKGYGHKFEASMVLIMNLKVLGRRRLDVELPVLLYLSRCTDLLGLLAHEREREQPDHRRRLQPQRS
jgi:hypothetical protein